MIIQAFTPSLENGVVPRRISVSQWFFQKTAVKTRQLFDMAGWHRNVTPFFSAGFTGFLAATIITAVPTGASNLSTKNLLGDQNNIPSEIVIINANSILGAKQPDPEIPLRIRRYITAYSSSPDETDNTPFITASGKWVRHGIVASNFLPFGAKIKIPDIFGETVFVVEDRMHNRFNDRIDIWMPTKKDALVFGKKLAEVEILLD